MFPNYKNAELSNWASVVPKDQKAPPTIKQDGMQVPEPLVGEFADFVVWDGAKKAPVAVSRNAVGEQFFKTVGIDPALEGKFEVTLADGKKVEVRTVFDLTRQYLDDNMTPEKASKICWAPKEAIQNLARQIAGSEGRTLIAVGMGPNQFWNNDNKDRALFLILALAGSLGRHGGNIGSYAGTYKNTLFSGVPKWTAEDPFHPQLDPKGEVKPHYYLRPESMHYWANGERLMKAGDKKITTGAHVPTPTKSIWQVNSNSSLGNQKGHYDVVNNTLPRAELVVYNEWWWTASCEYSDIVYGVDSWMEFKYPDMTASNTNPFVQIFPRTPAKRAFNTISDNDTYLYVARELTKLTGDKRFEDMWHFIADQRADIYLQRIIDGSTGGSGAEFVNHSCEPNLIVDIAEGRVYFVSAREIACGEELLLDYRLRADDHDAPPMPCRCGAPGCRGFLNAP